MTANASTLDFSTVEGDWVSVTELPFGVSRVRAQRVGPVLVVNAHGAGGPVYGDWGTAEANGIFVMQSGAGIVFTAEFDGETVCSQLQSYRALGVLAVHVFHRFIDGSGRRDFFTREHYVRAEGRRSQPTRPRLTSPVAGEGFPAELLAGEHDASALLDTWLPVDPPAKGIARLVITQSDDSVTVRAQGVGAADAGGPATVDWGEAIAHVYSDVTNPEGPPAILTTFDHGDRLVHLEIRQYLGTLIVGEYVEFTDGAGRSDYFIREVYVHE
ncbi:MAG: hypothetical protein ACRDOO_01695 [Actinomadura sp.]